MSLLVETKGGQVASVTDEGAAVDYTVNDTSSTPVELVAKAAVDAAHGTTPTPDTGAKAAAEAAAKATAKAADDAAAEFDDGDPTTNPTA